MLAVDALVVSSSVAVEEADRAGGTVGVSNVRQVLKVSTLADNAG